MTTNPYNQYTYPLDQRFNMRCAMCAMEDEIKFTNALDSATSEAAKKYHIFREEDDEDLLKDTWRLAMIRALDWKHYTHCIVIIEDLFVNNEHKPTT